MSLRTRTLSLVCTAVAGVLLGGCPASPLPLVLPAAPPAPGAPLPKKGDFVHAGSGLLFPEKAAGFERHTPRRYDEAGDDVGVGYGREHGDLHVEVTIYVYPPLRGPSGAPVPFDEQFTAEVAEVRGAHAGAAEVRRAEAAGTLAGRPVPARTVEFEIDLRSGFRSERVTSFLTLMPFDRWIVKYRVTAPRAERSEALTMVAALLAELGFPPTGLSADESPPAGAPGGR